MQCDLFLQPKAAFQKWENWIDEENFPLPRGCIKKFMMETEGTLQHSLQKCAIEDVFE